MTDEEYLRACGWTSGEIRSRSTSLADAVEAQLDEDRARFAFVLARTPQPEPRSCDPGFAAGVPWQEATRWPKKADPKPVEVTTPEDARRLFGVPMYEPDGKPSNAAAAAIQALKMQRPVVAVKVGGPLTGKPSSRPSSLSEWAENEGRWVRNWTSMPAGRVAVAVTLDERTGLWTGNSRAFFVSPGDAREAVDDLLRKQGLL